MAVLPAPTQQNLFSEAIRRVRRACARPTWLPWGTSMDQAGRRDAWADRLRLLSGTRVLALMDQAVVSATSFLTTVIIGRTANPGELGIYAIGISVLASSYTIQGSLISNPYSIQRHHPLGTPAQHAGSALAHSGLLSAMAAIVLTVTASALYAFGAQSELVAMTWALAAVAPFALLREFCRRFAFTHLQIVQSLMLDVAVAAIQLSSLAWLGWTGRMSAIAACGALGVACGVVTAAWLYFSRAGFAIELGQVRATMKQSWGLGKWLSLAQITVQVQRYAVYWLSVMIAGAAVTGVYAACMSVVSFANPVMYGFGNILTPRSVVAWKEGGGVGLRRQVVRDGLVLGAVMAAFGVLVLFVGEHVMHFLYHSKEYEGQGHTITVLAFATLAWALSMPPGNALASMERPRALVGANALTAFVTVFLVWWLMTEWRLMGAAYGLLLGNIVGCVTLWASFLTLVPRTCDPTPARRVLQMFTHTSDTADWAIARLGEGDHAIVYAIRSKDGEPLWRSYSNLVIKVYKPEAGASLEMVNAQFASLSRLHAALHGRLVNTWKISTPRPLHVCKSPLALVMTAVSGKSLNSPAVADNELTPEVLNAIARAFIAAMQELWSRGELHGDLALQNILYDIERKNLSFIDPGTRESCGVCNEVGKRWRPAVLELGHIVRDLGMDMRDMIGHPIARLRRQVFVESAVRTFLETIDPCDEKKRLLRELRACAQAHLWEILKLSWSPRGLADRLLGQIVVRRMDSVLDRLKVELSACEAPLAPQPRLFVSETQRVEA
jgi:O-antigen/teichoic acid export membrane protein